MILVGKDSFGLCKILMRGEAQEATYFGSSSSLAADFTRPPPISLSSRSSLCFRLSSFSTHPPYLELLPSSMTDLTVPTVFLYAAVSRTGFVAISIPLAVTLTPLLTPLTTDVSHVQAAPCPMALPVDLRAEVVADDAVPEAAVYAARARLIDSFSVN